MDSSVASHELVYPVDVGEENLASPRLLFLFFPYQTVASLRTGCDRGETPFLLLADFSLAREARKSTGTI